MPLFDQILQVSMELGLTDSVGCLVLVLSQPPYRSQVGLLGAQGHPAHHQGPLHPIT